MNQNQTVTVKTTVNASVETVWKFWTEPEHIKNWNNASDDWHTTAAENDLQVGGKFMSRMEAKDGSFGFDFSGVYDEVEVNHCLAYTLGDERKVKVTFSDQGGKTEITETFDADSSHSVEMQEAGWQAILDNFKRYTEAAVS